MISAGDQDFSTRIRGKRLLVVASTGGHLAQARRLVPRLGAATASYVTFDQPQSRGLLAGEDVRYVPYVASRDWRGSIRSLGEARRILDDVDPEVVLSTGAAIAVPFLFTAARRGVDALYLESISRVSGPSLSGRMLRWTPGVDVHTPHAWAGGAWAQGPSVLTAFEPGADLDPVDAERLRVFVTLGTIKPYRFDALVDAVLRLARPGWTLTWQLGETSRADLPGDVESRISAERFDQEVRASDVVISHAGVGSALQIMELGRTPVLVPRRAAAGEHVDDHQQQIADYLAERHLAVVAEPTRLSLEDLLASRRACLPLGEP